MKSVVVLVFVISCFTFTNSASVLPPWLTPCKGSDPNLPQCAEKEANKIIPMLVKGYPKLNVPVMNPLHIPEIKVQLNSQFKISLKDVDVYGLEETRAFDFNYDFKGFKIDFKLEIPRLVLLGEYDMDGRILFPVTGKGPGNITVVGGVYDIEFTYSLFEKKGVQYGHMDTVDVNIDIKRLYVQFDNLFNGNKELGDAANKAANNEWRVIFKELEPTIKECVKEVVLTVANGIGDRVPYGDIFSNEFPA
ncbi:circadian clock-controlled protein daywake-like [Chrysoperla carnea]|uniref:circadian clock-controlled protein daywake-like n=1 Tax=Chrysoperla carnea TaxID=189513 RepID=UPI001D08D854|nr:circadian clock-controlled protein daywake-like [Chrysoperla carnea]